MSGSAAILAFHAVEDGPGPLCLGPAVFERQVRALAAAGAVGLTVSDVASRLRRGDTLPRRAVAFTFDDGFESVHRHALPILAAHGFPATVFAVTAQLGGTNAWDAGKGGLGVRRLLDAPQLLELRDAGWEIGGHSHTHRALPGLSAAELDAELVGCRDRLEDLLGAAVASFAYPYGLADETSRRSAAGAFTTCVGIGASMATASSPADNMGRVDAWYVQRAWQLQGLHDARGAAYLAVRRAARRLGPARASTR